MSRDFCVKCRRLQALCLCPKDPPMPTRTRLVLLMHFKEWRREKCATGRLTHLNLANSEIIPGIDFDEHPRVRALLDDPENFAVLLYPKTGAMNLSEGGFPAELLAGRRLVVFLIDATWSCARSVLTHSPGLLTLPRLMFKSSQQSRFVIKRQPKAWCLSTIEATHELLIALEAAGLDEYPDKERLLASFNAMQDFQIRMSPKHRQLAQRGPRMPEVDRPG